jgi:hypothetical protein
MVSFPEDEGRNVIEGRKALPGHNDFDANMSLWGVQFQEEVSPSPLRAKPR